MSLPQETLLQLMALADGELEGEEKSRVEALVASDLEARQVVEAMRSPALGNWLDDEMSARSGLADGIADFVMAELESEGAVAAPSPTAANGADMAVAEGGAVVRLVQPAAEPSRRKTSRLQVLAGAAVGALALAAGVAIYFTSVSSGSDDGRAPVASVGSPSVDVVPPQSASGAVAIRPSALPSQGVEVDEVDSPSRGFSVFEIPVGGGAVGAAKAGGPSSVVIMIDDDPGAK